MSKVSIRVDKVAGKIPINMKMALSIKTSDMKIKGVKKDLIGKLELTSDFVWELDVKDSKLSINICVTAKINRESDLGRISMPLDWFPPNTVVQQYFPLSCIGYFVPPVYLFLTVHYSTTGILGFDVPSSKLAVHPAWPPLDVAMNQPIMIALPMQRCNQQYFQPGQFTPNMDYPGNANSACPYPPSNLVLPTVPHKHSSTSTNTSQNNTNSPNVAQNNLPSSSNSTQNRNLSNPTQSAHLSSNPTPSVHHTSTNSEQQSTHHSTHHHSSQNTISQITQSTSKNPSIINPPSHRPTLTFQSNDPVTHPPNEKIKTSYAIGPSVNPSKHKIELDDNPIEDDENVPTYFQPTKYHKTIIE